MITLQATDGCHPLDLHLWQLNQGLAEPLYLSASFLHGASEQCILGAAWLLALGQVLLMVQRTQRELPGYEGPREEATQDKGTLKVSSCQAYDYLLLAALKAQVSSSRRMQVNAFQ